MINIFVLDIKPGGRHWISKDLLYGPSKKGGFGIIKLTDFTTAIKCTTIAFTTMKVTNDDAYRETRRYEAPTPVTITSMMKAAIYGT